MTNGRYRCCSFFTSATIFAYATYSNVLLAALSNNYCEVERSAYHFDLSRGTLQEATLGTGAELGFTREELNAGMTIDEDESQLVTADFNFQYTIFDFNNSITLMTNGHLHTWDFPLGSHNKGTGYTLSYYLAPVISVSSNIMKNPDLLDREGLQLWGEFIYKKEHNSNGEWLIGFRSDHRFGPYHAYPVVGYCWKPDESWQLQLALPDFSMRKIFSNTLSIKLYTEPDGNKWHVYSRDKIRDSDFFYDAVVTGFAVEWRINSSVRLELEAVKHTRRRFDFVLDNNTPVKTRAESSSGMTVGAEFLF